MGSIPISQLIAYGLPHALRNDDVVKLGIPQINKAKQYHYILGDDGQDSNGAALGGVLVMDCNGFLESFLNFQLPGTDHNTRARYNYASWCSSKGNDMSKMPQKPGVGVYVGETAQTIEHVGILCCKFGTGQYDWLVLQSESPSLGFRLTKLHVGANGSGRFSFWGVMDKFFAYDLDASFDPFKRPIKFNYASCPYPTPTTLPAYGDYGDAVRWLQWQLIMHDHLVGSSGPVRNGIDSDYGDAVKAALAAYEAEAKVTGNNVIKALLGQLITPPVTPPTQPKPPVPPVTPSKPTIPATYTVIKGDSLSGIASKFGLNWPDLATLNNVAGPKYIITPGQVLKLK